MNGQVDHNTEDEMQQKVASDAEEYAEEESKNGNKKWN
jgi:hypothetical protein